MKTLLLVTLALFLSPAFATDNHIHDPVKPPVVPGTPTQQSVPAPAPVAQDNDRKEAFGYTAVVVSGLATAALKDKQYGAIWAFGGTVAAAAVIEAAQSGSYHGENVGYAALGALVGSVGTCALYFKKNFMGCAVPFK